MKNKKSILIIALALLALAGLTIYFVLDYNKDSSKFKREYESYNNISYREGNESGKYLELDISKNNPIIYLNDDNLIDEVSHGNKIIYFGFPDCNWCRAALPALLKAASDDVIGEIYYYNPWDIREAYMEGEKNSKSKIYEELINIVGEKIEDTFIEGVHKGEKRLTVPTVILMKEGKVAGYHNVTVDSHTDYNSKLNDKQFEELYEIYNVMMEDLILCSDTSGC